MDKNQTIKTLYIFGAIMSIIAYLLPWLTFDGVLSLSGYEIPKILSMGPSDPPKKYYLFYLIHLIPVFSGITLLLIFAGDHKEYRYIYPNMLWIVIAIIVLMLWPEDSDTLSKNAKLLLKHAGIGLWISFVGSFIIIGITANLEEEEEKKEEVEKIATAMAKAHQSGFSCRECGITVSEDASFCPSCGVKDPAPVCPECHTKILGNYSFCRSCGNKLKPSISSPKTVIIVSGLQYEQKSGSTIETCTFCDRKDRMDNLWYCDDMKSYAHRDCIPE